MRKLSYARDGGEGSIDMTPMLDIVFIMLIFFIVTTSFGREVGVPVHGLADKADKISIEPTEAIAVRIEAGNAIRIEGRLVDVGAVSANIERLLAQAPNSTIVVLASDKSNARTLVDVIDGVRLAGIDSVPVARLTD